MFQFFVIGITLSDDVDEARAADEKAPHSSEN